MKRLSDLFSIAKRAISKVSIKERPMHEYTTVFKTDLIGTDSIKVFQGHALPLGCSSGSRGVNFAIYSEDATHVWLQLFQTGEHDAIAEIALCPNKHKTGDIWHVEVNIVKLYSDGLRYAYRMDRQPNDDPKRYRFDPTKILLDPYARALSGASRWGETYTRSGDVTPPDEYEIRSRRCIVHNDYFDWEEDRQLAIPISETIIYELHVRGFTNHPSSGVKDKGTFEGLCEKIPYLQSLGVTAVELLPVYEFEEIDTDRFDPVTDEPLVNYWGYHPISFFAPKATYSRDGRNGQQVLSFKRMVKAFHQAGIEVILDVVFNHTAEGDARGHTFNFRGIDNPVYYILDEEGNYTNYSGCGNTVNCNHPVVRTMIIDALHYWVMEMHVDGFRFDLASILGRGQNGEVLSSPPLIEHIAHDPILAKTKLIAEAWDAAGLYQVGTFPAWQRWAEWNGHFRDDVRRFIKSDEGQVSALAQRMAGSPDIYSTSGREASHSINFITSHDGFTLRDLVSYDHKHNVRNGEDGRDGDNHNFSWNCGAEGETGDADILALRQRQQKNFAVLLLLANGVPMLLAGDEFGRTQQGNNNAYCQDNELSWIDWSLMQTNADLLRFFKSLIDFRKKVMVPIFQNSASCRRDYHGVTPGHPDWSESSHTLGIRWRQEAVGDEKEREVASVYLFANAHWEVHDITLPTPQAKHAWHRVLDTFTQEPLVMKRTALRNRSTYRVEPRSCVVFVERKKLLS